MTLKQVKKDLQDIRYYYTHKAMFDKAENTGFKSEAVRKSEEYGPYPKPRRGCTCSTIYYMWKGRRSMRRLWNRT